MTHQTPEQKHLYSAYIKHAGQAFTLCSTSPNPLDHLVNAMAPVYKGVWDDGTPVWVVEYRGLWGSSPAALAEAFARCEMAPDDLAVVVEYLLGQVHAYYDAIGEGEARYKALGKALLDKSPRLRATNDAREAALLGEATAARSLAERNTSIIQDDE